MSRTSRRAATRRPLRALLAMAAVGLALVPGAADAATSTPNDPYFTQGTQWALTGQPASIDAPPAWCVSTGTGVLVADVDTGADFGHPDLAGKLVAGHRFTNGDGSDAGSGTAAVSDDNGHGTLTSGLITADTDNGRGIAAVAPDSRVLVVKVLVDDPMTGQASGTDADVAAGIEYAVAAGARVINLSIGTEVPLTGATTAIPAAIQDAWNHDVLVSVAAGNSSLPASSYGDITPYALVVGALGPNALPAYYSNSLFGVNLYAPGGDDPTGNGSVQDNIVSTAFNGGYAQEQGTSFAAPLGAGVAALLMAHGLDAHAAYSRILATATNRNGLPDLNAAAALGAPATAACGSTAAQGGGGAGGSGGAVVRPSSSASRPSAGGSVPGATAPPSAAAPTAATTTPAPGSITPSPGATAGAVAYAPGGAGGSGSPDLTGGGGLGASAAPLAIAVGLAAAVAATFAVVRRRRGIV